MAPMSALAERCLPAFACLSLLQRTFYDCMRCGAVLGPYFQTVQSWLGGDGHFLHLSNAGWQCVGGLCLIAALLACSQQLPLPSLPAAG